MWLRLSIALVVAGTTAVIPTPVQAQTQIDMTPHVGMYFPLNSAVAETSQDLTMRQVSAVVLGGHLAVHAARRWLVEAYIDYSPSPVAISADDRTIDRNGGVVLGSVRTAWRIGKLKPKTPELQLGAGVGFVSRFGRAWQSHSGTVDPAIVVGVAGRYPLSKYMPINVRVEIGDYITRAQFTPTGESPTTAWRNHDTIWSVGFEIPMNGREQK
jgi:hypothetical protein